MIPFIGESVKSSILNEIIECGSFSIIKDEMSDLSHKEQVSIFVRCVKFENQNSTICEHVITLQETNQTSGVTLTELLLNILSRNFILVESSVGQGYNGGSHMRDANKEVKSRIKEINLKF